MNYIARGTILATVRNLERGTEITTRNLREETEIAIKYHDSENLCTKIISLINGELNFLGLEIPDKDIEEDFGYNPAVGTYIYTKHYKDNVIEIVVQLY